MRSRIVEPRKAVLLSALAIWAAWLLRRAERDYEERERLAPGTTAASWALYLLHAGLTVWRAARRRSRPLPVAKAPAVALGSISALSGCWLYAWAMQEFRSFGQASGMETGNLVTSGPYRYTRGS